MTGDTRPSTQLPLGPDEEAALEALWRAFRVAMIEEVLAEEAMEERRRATLH